MSEKLKYDITYNDPETGKEQKIKKGTILFDEKDQEAKERRKKVAYYRQLREDHQKKLGGFVIMRSVPLKKRISMQTLGRLAYLSIYLGYDDDNRLMLTRRQSMYRQDLPDVLKLPQRTVERFLKEAKASGILTVDKYGQLFMSDTFFRGKTRRRKIMRLYRKPIQQLYKNLILENEANGDQKSNGIKYFGYIIALIPYVNKEWNIVCTEDTVNEKDIRKVKYLSIREICELLDFNPSNSRRLINILTNIWFTVYDEDDPDNEYNGKKQALCNFIKEIHESQYRMIINPDVLYMGGDPTQVKAYGQHFPVWHKAKKP